MHDTGIVRRVDDLGRIVIPMELRRTLGIHRDDRSTKVVDPAYDPRVVHRPPPSIEKKSRGRETVRIFARPLRAVPSTSSITHGTEHRNR